MTHAMTPAVDASGFRAALGRYPTGVTIVTARDSSGAPFGMTVNSFASLSLDPPLILWCIRLFSRSYPRFRDACSFAVNVLAEGQETVSQRFASDHDDRFAGVAWQQGLDGVPVLADCAAVLECSQEDRHAAGDHVVVIGRVRRLSVSERRPLLFWRGRYGAVGAAPAGA